MLSYSRSSFFVLEIRIRAPIEKQLGTIGVAQRDGVEERSTAVSIDHVDVGAT